MDASKASLSESPVDSPPPLTPGPAADMAGIGGALGADGIAGGGGGGGGADPPPPIAEGIAGGGGGGGGAPAVGGSLLKEVGGIEDCGLGPNGGG